MFSRGNPAPTSFPRTREDVPFANSKVLGRALFPPPRGMHLDLSNSSLNVRDGALRRQHRVLI